MLNKIDDAFSIISGWTEDELRVLGGGMSLVLSFYSDFFEERSWAEEF